MSTTDPTRTTAGRGLDEPQWEPRDELEVLNTDQRRLDGPAKVTGRARYTHDVRLPDMVYARFKILPYPRAKIASLDLSGAEAIDGVVHVEAIKEEGEDVRYLGADAVIAVVCAETPEAADDAIHAIAVEREEEWPPVMSIEQALDPESPGVGPRGAKEGRPDTRGDEGAVFAALDECDEIVQARYVLPVQHHACLETHGTVVDYRGGDEAVVYSSLQAVSGAHRGVVRTLELPGEKVKVVTEHMGGGFGAKFGIGVEGQQALRLSKLLGRPVHLMLTRKDEFLMAGNRSGSIQDMEGGATADGTFKALFVDAIREGGMGGGSLPTHPYIYAVEHGYHRARPVYTAMDSSRAMRAPGHPQASFAIESLVDELSYAIGMDPLEFRKKNLTDPVWHRQLDRVAQEIGWFDHDKRTSPGEATGDVEVGIGFGVSVWGGAGRPGTVCEVRIAPSGEVTASTCTQDLGTGSRTLVAMITAEEFGLPTEAVTPRIGDSSLPPSVASGGSVTTGSLAPAVKDAAHNAREAFAPKVAEALGVDAGTLRWREGKVFSEDDDSKSMTWAQACALLGTDPLVATGEWKGPPRGEHGPRRPGGQGRGGHPHRSGACGRHGLRPGRGPGPEPAGLPQPGERRDDPGPLLRPVRGARGRRRARHVPERQLRGLQAGRGPGRAPPADDHRRRRPATTDPGHGGGPRHPRPWCDRQRDPQRMRRPGEGAAPHPRQGPDGPRGEELT